MKLRKIFNNAASIFKSRIIPHQKLYGPPDMLSDEDIQCIYGPPIWIDDSDTPSLDTLKGSDADKEDDKE